MNLLSDAAYWMAGALALVALVAGAWLTSRTPPGTGRAPS